MSEQQHQQVAEQPGGSPPLEKKARTESFGAPGAYVDAQASMPSISVRILIDEKSVGGLIGKKGVVVNKLRSDTGCQIDIAKPTAGATKRVVSITGRADTIGLCLSMVSNRLFEQKMSGRSAEGGAALTHSLTLLVDNSLVGAIIGKGGQHISATRTTTGAAIQISEKALDNSTEKSVRCTGTSQAVDAAINIMLPQMLEKGGRGVSVPYVPLPEGFAMDPYAAYGQQMGQQFQQQQVAQGGGYGQQYPQQSYGDAPLLQPAYGQPATQQPPFRAPAAAYGQGQQSTVLITVPEAYIGAVIGRGGKSISEIRSRSGAQVQIPKAEADQADRQISITGSAMANELAAQLINEKVTQAMTLR